MKKSASPVTNTNAIMRLTQEQQSDPKEVIDEFFTNYHLADVRELLWNWLTAGLTNDNHFRDGRSRSNLIFLYEQMEAFTEATFLLRHKRIRPKHR